MVEVKYGQWKQKMAGGDLRRVVGAGNEQRGLKMGGNWQWAPKTSGVGLQTGSHHALSCAKWWWWSKQAMVRLNG